MTRATRLQSTADGFEISVECAEASVTNLMEALLKGIEMVVPNLGKYRQDVYQPQFRDGRFWLVGHVRVFRDAFAQPGCEPAQDSSGSRVEHRRNGYNQLPL